MSAQNMVARDVERAADALRTANHSTCRGRLDGPHTFAVVGELAVLVDRVPQLLDFLIGGLAAADPAEHYDDHGCAPAETLAAAAGALERARAGVIAAGDALRDAHNQTARLGRRVTDPDPASDGESFGEPAGGELR